jgi:hypothetical protein
MHRKVKPDLNDNSTDAKIRSELVKNKIKFHKHRDQDMDSVMIAQIRAHASKATGGNPALGLDKHWRLSTLEFIVDDNEEITHLKCVRD